MCSFVRVGSPKALQTSLEPSTAFPLERSSPGRMTAPEIKEVGLTQEQKDDIIDRTLRDSKSPSELGLELKLRQNRRCRERMVSPETKSPLCHALGVELERHTISRTPVESSNLGVHRGSTFQEPKPLGVLPGKVGSENEGLPPGLPWGRTLQSPLDAGHGSSQAAGSAGRPVTCGPAWTDAVVEKQPVAGLELRKEVEKEPTCVVVNPYAETPPEGVDIGLPRTQEPGEASNAEPQIGLVTEASECPFAQQPEEKKESEAMEPGVEDPAHLRPIYSGKFFDRMPCWPSVSSCCVWFLFSLGFPLDYVVAMSLPR